MAASTNDYIPIKNVAFNNWQSNFVSEATGFLAIWSINPLNPDWLRVVAKANDWNNAWRIANPFAASRTHPLVVDLRTVRRDYEKTLRYFIQNYLARNRNVTPEQRATINITIRKKGRTTNTVPADRAPVGKVNKWAHLMHELRISDPANPSLRRKCNGVKLSWVFMAIVEQGETPQQKDFRMIGNTSTHKFVTTFKPDAVGKRAFYFIKWADSRGKMGLPSEAFSLTIM